MIKTNQFMFSLIRKVRSYFHDAAHFFSEQSCSRKQVGGHWFLQFAFAFIETLEIRQAEGPFIGLQHFAFDTLLNLIHILN